MSNRSIGLFTMVLGSAVLFGAAFVLRYDSVDAAAEPGLLPPIFVAGAEVITSASTGPLLIQEVQGEWIRVKKMPPFATADGAEEWIYVPAIEATWRLNSSSGN